MADAGKVIPIYKGDWVIHSSYEVLDQTTHDGSTYTAKNNIADSAITPDLDTTNWFCSSKGFVGSALTDITAEDTSGLLGLVGDTVSSQVLIDKIADMVADKLVLKTAISNQQVNDSAKVTGSALAYSMGQSIDTLNSNLNNRDYLYSKNVILFGDSISVGSESWSAHLSTHLNNSGGSLTNKAVGGYIIQQVTDAVNNTENLNNYDVCIVFCGTNNIGGSVTATISDLKNLYSALLNYTGDLYIITPIHRANEVGSVDTSAGAWILLSQISNSIYNVFGRKFKVINGFNAGNIPLQDGLHPTAEGSQLLYNWIYESINSRSGNFNPCTTNPVNLPITSISGTIVSAKGYVTSAIESTVHIVMTYTPPGTGIQYISLNFHNAGASWIDNAFESVGVAGCAMKTSMAGTPVYYRNSGGNRELWFIADSVEQYDIVVKIKVPNLQVY